MLETTETVQTIPHALPGELQKHVVDFLDINLRSATGFSVNQEYPSLFGDFPGGESLIVQINGKIASHVGMMVRDFHSPHFRMKVGLIGSVATAPEFQNRGLATTLLNRSFAELKRRGCTIVFLWSNSADFYTPLGFQRSGVEIDLRFSGKQFSSDVPLPKEYDPKRHLHMLWRLYQKHDVRVDRSLEEQRKLCLIPKSRIFITERDGAVSSYLVVNKGADFDGYIHEWGGDLEELAKNIASVQRHAYFDKNLTLIAPAHYDIAPIRKIATLEWQGVLGLAKILDGASLMNCYHQFLRAKNIPFQWQKETQEIIVNNQAMPLKSEQDILSLTLGNEGGGGQPKLPFFLWGYDSI